MKVNIQRLAGVGFGATLPIMLSVDVEACPSEHFAPRRMVPPEPPGHPLGLPAGERAAPRPDPDFAGHDALPSALEQPDELSLIGHTMRSLTIMAVGRCRAPLEQGDLVPGLLKATSSM